MLTATTQITALMPDGLAGSAPEQKQYTVTIAVSGTLSKPTLVLSSDPPLQPEVIVALITFGTTQGAGGSALSRSIQGFLTQQLAGFGTRKLGQVLGVESLNFEVQGENGPTLTAVKRVTPRLSVTYQAPLQHIGESKVTAAYRLLPFLYIAGSGSTLDSGGIDLHFRLSK